MPRLTLAEIQQLLPHRSPFLFVDEIEDYELGIRIIGRKRFSADDFFLQSGLEFVPETLLIETAAQVGALLILKDPAYSDKIPYFMSVEGMTFHRRIRVGETVRVVGTIERIRGAFGILSGQAWVGEEHVAEGTMRVALADRSSAAADRSPI
ncbi:MAG: beta-hydroxyacyl-ACP dehydratase [Acidobacteriia bacterium]|nr:beta-hydroxyacyl-ACP dehydratase [Terriglobia bacterium]